MPPNIALIGCGAIAQAFYLPAMAKHRARFGELWLVDPSEHALAGAAAILSGKQARRLSDVRADLDIVIVATPNHLHHPLALEALERGAHVLIEKPFVIFPEEGRALMAAAAAANNRVIAINQTRRLHPIAGDLRRRISTGEFGALRSVVHPEGTKLTWPFESGAGFAPGATRTGVIMDFGVHVLDFYHYLLQPTWSLTSATHDGFAGPEGLAEIELEANGASVSLRLSRYYTQANVARMTFERAEISFGVYDDTTYTVRSLTSTSAPTTTVRVNGDVGTAPERLLLNLLAACESREPAICDAASSMPVIVALDTIYRDAQRYPVALGAA
jgi:predicted dehydrogenase